MIQFNLLPDVKLQFIRAKRIKRSVILISALVALGCLTILVILLLAVDVFQKKHLKDVNNDIKTYTNKLQSTPELNKVLTIQNQLKSLPGLEQKNPVTTRLFNYLAQIVPSQINISSLNIDLGANTMSFSGSTGSLNDVNVFVDTLKFTTYSSGGSRQKNAFSNVVLSSFSRNTTETTYQIDVSFDPPIFDTSQDVAALTVPNTITTRSTTEQPFKKQAPLNGPGR